MSFIANIDQIVADNRNRLLGAHPSWTRVRLKEVARILNGYPFESSRFSKSEGSPLIRIRDILDGRTETFYQGAIDQTFMVQRGEILVGMDGDFHCAPWGGDPALLNQRVCKITPDESRYAKQFLRYVLPGYLNAIHAETPSVTVKHLSSRTVAEIPLPLPPLSEQREIVAEIEEQFARLDAGVAALRRTQANLKRYRTAVLKAACEGRLVPTEAELYRNSKSKTAKLETGAALLARVLAERRQNAKQGPKYKEPVTPDISTLPLMPAGWTYASVEQLGFVQLGRQRAPQHHTGEFMRPYLRVANVFEDRIDLSDVKTMNFTPKEFEVFQLKPNDILLNEGQSLELIGRPAIYRGELPGSCFTNTLVRFRPCASLNVKYAFLVFRAFMHSGQFQKIAKWTTNIAHLGADRFAKLAVQLPPLAEQRRIVAEVERRLSIAEGVEAAVKSNLQRATRLRQSILKKAFSGGIGEDASSITRKYYASTNRYRGAGPTLSKQKRARLHQGGR